MDSILGYLSAYTVQANLVRRLVAEHPVEQLAAFVRASVRHGLAFTLAIGTDGNEGPVEDSPEWWTAQLDKGDAFQRQFGGLVLTTEGPGDATNVAYNVERGSRQAYARLRVDLPQDRASIEIAGWLADAADAFEAELAWVHTTDLLELVRGARAPVDAPTWWGSLAPDVMRAFASLRPANELEICEVPEAVWWMNVWSAATAAALEPAVTDATWHQDRTLPSGRRLLIATADPPDASHLEEIAQVASITEAIGLAQRQGA